MKPYFTKYLPLINEEPENGDLIHHPDIKNSPIIFDSSIHFKLISLGWSKVKLFLCSRDIQVGDKFNSVINNIFTTGICEEIYGDTIKVKSSFTGVKCLKSEAFKVIGEVSPDAIWIKENMEFEEPKGGFYKGEFQVLPIYEGDTQYTLLGSRRQLQGVINHDLVEKYIVLFKCPTCGTFH